MSTPTVLVLRRLLESDLGAVLAIEQTVYPWPWTEGNFRDSIRSGYHCLAYVPENEPTSHMVGYAIYMDGVEEAHLLNLAICAELQGQGQGRKLLRAVMQHARSGGALRLLLEVRPSNEAARGLYLSEGFSVLGTRRQYYPAGSSREDAIVMEKIL